MKGSGQRRGQRHGLFSRVSRSDRAFDIVNIALMALIVILCLYPFYYCVVLSFNDGYDALDGGIYFWPRVFSLENYKTVLSDDSIGWAFLVTMARTALGTVMGTLYCAMVSFALVRPQLKLRRLYITIGLITMYFSGGIIPLYILVMNLGLLDNFWVYIVPNLSSFFNLLIMMAFFRELPPAMIESAKVDGANELRLLLSIVLPTSGAVLATIGLFTAVFHWNTWFDGYIYISSQRIKTLPLLLVEMINQGLAMEKLRTSGRSLLMSEMVGPTENSVRLATMVVAILPILCAYPFCQKYFVKGMMLGAIKG